MSDMAVVCCPSCSQKYRVRVASVGQRARCKKCGTTFRVSDTPEIDEDTIFGWMTDDDPASESVMGSTGIMQSADHAPLRSAPAPGPRMPVSFPRDHTDTLMRLEKIDAAGAHFVFPAAMLSSEPLRNAFPRRCVGCGAKLGLEVYLLRWSKRGSDEEATPSGGDEEPSVGTLDAFEGVVSGLLAQLPRRRHLAPPFDLPFPVFACAHCRVARWVQGRVVNVASHAVCQLTIASLALAVGFFRNNGGRNTPDYHRLIEARDQRYDAWRSLAAAVRERLGHWFTPQSGERFVNFFCDEEFSATQAGISGMVLTDRRLVFKKYAACRDFPLTTAGRMEIRPQGTTANVSIIDEGHRPAVVKLNHSRAEELETNLRMLGCTWTVVR